MPAAALYCGGCNPRYDRVALVKRLGLPGWASGKACGLLVVVCGCGARCADYAHVAARQVLVIDGPEGEQAARELLITELRSNGNGLENTV